MSFLIVVVVFGFVGWLSINLLLAAIAIIGLILPGPTKERGT